MLFLRENLRAVQEVDVTPADRDRIFFGNSRDLVRPKPLS